MSWIAFYNACANHYCHYCDDLAPVEAEDIGALPMTGDMRFTEQDESYHKS